MFIGQGRFKNDWFDVRLDLGDGEDWYNWKDICRYYPNVRHAIETYQIQTVEVIGMLAEIVDLFVRIKLYWQIAHFGRRSATRDSTRVDQGS